MLAAIFPWLAPLLGGASPLNWLAFLVFDRRGRIIALILAGLLGGLYVAHRLIDHGRQIEHAKVEAARVEAVAAAHAEKESAIAADNAQRERDAAEIAALQRRIADLEKAPPAPAPVVAQPATSVAPTYLPPRDCGLSGPDRDRLRDLAGASARRRR